MSIEAFIREAVAKQVDEERAKRPKPLPEAVVSRLRELLPAFTAEQSPYKVGDLVTPRADSAMRSAGEPHVVVAVLDEPDYFFDRGEVSSNAFGQRLDTRVIHITDEKVFAHWVESADLVPYQEA